MPTNEPDIRILDRRAVIASVAMARRAGPSDLYRPTPCAGWNLGDLLAHMTAQHRGFRAACLGQWADREAWQPRPLGDDPVAAFADAADGVLAAFADDDVLERRLLLPEISGTTRFPASQAIGFHFIDSVAHGWDLARTLGEEFVLDDDLAPAALAIAEAVPNGTARTRPEALFQPALRVAGSDTTPLDRILLHLGRAPDWAPGA